MTKHEETARKIAERHLGPHGAELKTDIARVIEEAEAAGVNTERKWWIGTHIEIAAMPAPNVKTVIACPSNSEMAPQDACQIGWAGCCMAWGAAICARPDGKPKAP